MAILNNCGNCNLWCNYGGVLGKCSTQLGVPGPKMLENPCSKLWVCLTGNDLRIQSGSIRQSADIQRGLITAVSGILS